MRNMPLCAAGTLAVLLPASLVLVNAQSQVGDVPPNTPKFDVASIKPSKSSNGMMGWTPDGIVVTGIPVQLMILQVFGIEKDQLIDAPGWVGSDRFDMQAKVAPEDLEAFRKIPLDDRSAMLLPLLEDRFHLKYHHETHELRLYNLVVAKGGPKLTKSATDPEMKRRMMMWRGRGNLEVQGVPIDDLAHQLAGVLGRRVKDKTGLTGNYDFKLRWTPDDARPVGAAAADNGQPAEDAPSLFTALQEQLGLKLESTKGNVDLIVIDHIDPPTPD
jgi:uncharacterized protein (TIGR03435 family)